MDSVEEQKKPEATHRPNAFKPRRLPNVPARGVGESARFLTNEFNSVNQITNMIFGGKK